VSQFAAVATRTHTSPRYLRPAWKPAVAAAVVCLVAACGGGSTGPDGGGGSGGANGTITATVDGQPFQATQAVAFIGMNDGGAFLSFTALDGCGSANTSIQLLANKLGSATVTAGDYSSARSIQIQLGPGVSTSYREFTGSLTVGSGQPWSTAYGGSGTLTITSLSASQVEGTFSFTAPLFGGGGTRSATGSFRAPIREVRLC
jgi:hypothetical protein